MKEIGIKSKVLLVSLIPTILISLLLGVFFTSSRINDLETSLGDSGKAIAGNLAATAEYGVAHHNIAILKKLIRASRAGKDIRAIAIYNTQGELLATTGDALNLNEEIKTLTPPFSIMNFNQDNALFIAPVFTQQSMAQDFDFLKDLFEIQGVAQANIQQKLLGWVAVALERERIDLEQYQALFTSTIILIMGLTISFIFAKRLGDEVSLPIIRLTEATNKIKQGHFDLTLNSNSEGEIKILESGILQMSQALKESHTKMRENINRATSDLRNTLKTIEIQNQELKVARKQALAASKVKSQFIANISHEIRTPMNGIIGFTNLMLKNTHDPTHIEYLTTIHKSATNLLKIINNILDFSKIEANKLDLEKKDFDLIKLTDETLEIFAALAHEKNLELTSFVYDDVPRMVTGDALRLQQILINLINNALKFTSKGEVIVRVMLDKETKKLLRLKVTVSDTGIGISSQNQNKIFNAFSQADPSFARKYGGTGLGLIIAKKLVSKMQGKIGFTSTLHHGSEFWFTFYTERTPQKIIEASAKFKYPHTLYILEPHVTNKIKLAHMLQVMDIKYSHITLDDLPKLQNQTILVSIKKSNAKILSTISSSNNIVIITTTNFYTQAQELCDKSQLNVIAKIIKPLTSVKVNEFLCQITDKNLSRNPLHNLDFKNALVVDDNHTNLKLLSLLLKNVNFNTICADNGKLAVQYAKQQKFDIIFMDLQMPHMDGFKTATAIIKDNINPPPIIAVSAYNSPEIRANVLKKNFVNFLAKPIFEEELNTIITLLFPQHLVVNKNPQQHDMQQQLFTIFLEELRPLADALQESFAHYDLNQLKALAHKLYGASACCNLLALKVLAKKFDKLMRNDASQQEAQEIFDELTIEINKVLEQEKVH